MKYSITKEYGELLERKLSIETSLEKLARGYISRKTINGKQYSYLQARTDGRLASRYLKSEETDRIEEELSLRKRYEAELPAIVSRLAELEKAAGIIGNGVDRALMLLRISSGMDALRPEEKARCVSFADAMNAIEGVAASRRTAEDAAKWRDGELSFLEVFSATLERYGFAVEV